MKREDPCDPTTPEIDGPPASTVVVTEPAAGSQHTFAPGTMVFPSVKIRVTDAPTAPTQAVALIIMANGTAARPPLIDTAFAFVNGGHEAVLNNVVMAPPPGSTSFQDYQILAWVKVNNTISASDGHPIKLRRQ